MTNTPAGKNENQDKKAELLSNPVEHIDVASFDARPIIAAMDKMSFTSRDLARSPRLPLPWPGCWRDRLPRAAACMSTAT